MAKMRVGVSGWSYDGWRRGAFYPPGLARRNELAWLSRRVGSLEINGSFYGLIRPATWEACREAVPPRFVLAVKGSRFITHDKKLGDVAVPLANFFASGLLRLEDRLGPILWQLPEAAAWAPERLPDFLARLPRDTRAASRLARRHDARLRGRASTAVHVVRRIRHALEVRDPRMLGPELVRVCRRHGVALVVSHAGDWPCVEEPTAGFVYVRLHGAPHTYASRYGDAALRGWAERIRRWAQGAEPRRARRITDRMPPPRRGRDVYVYFDNDRDAHAPRDARRLMRRLGLRAPADP